MKKFLSILLSLVMIFSLALPAFASSEESEENKVENFVDEITSNIGTTADSMGKIISLSGKAAEKLQPIVMEFVMDSANWEKAGDMMMKVITKLFDKVTPDSPDNPDTPDTPDNPDNPDNPDTPDTPDEPALPSITDIIKNLSVEDFVNLIKKYFIINVEDIDQTSQDIVDMAEYKYVTTEDGQKTVYIMVDIEKHPELLNRDLLMETVEKLYAKQNEEFSESADILMSYEHIAGELALHAILFAVTNEYLEITGQTEGTIYSLWARCRQADLNYDEARIPSEIIIIAGTYIMGVFIASYYTIYKHLIKQ